MENKKLEIVLKKLLLLLVGGSGIKAWRSRAGGGVPPAPMHFSSGLDKASRSVFHHKGLRRSRVPQRDCLRVGSRARSRTAGGASVQKTLHRVSEETEAREEEKPELDEGDRDLHVFWSCFDFSSFKSI